jgi:hypothetical protein
VYKNLSHFENLCVFVFILFGFSSQFLHKKYPFPSFAVDESFFFGVKPISGRDKMRKNFHISLPQSGCEGKLTNFQTKLTITPQSSAAFSSIRFVAHLLYFNRQAETRITRGKAEK